MQVQNIECQIAQAQLRRYLTGEEMPNAIVNDLETHLKHCPECMAAAQSLRESLRGALTAKVSGRPEPELPKPEPKAQTKPKQKLEPKAVVQTPTDVLDAPDSAFKPEKPRAKRSNMKTLFYSGALALVLILMSTVFKDPTALFGPRAIKFHKDAPPATTNNDKPAQTSTVQTPNDGATTAQTTAQADTSATNTGQPTITGTATTGGQAIPAANSGPIQTNGLIVADSVTGTTIVKTEPKKQDPHPEPTKQPAKSTAKPQQRKKPVRKTSGSAIVHVKVYPPDK